MRIMEKRAAKHAFVAFGVLTLLGLVIACQGPVGLTGAAGATGPPGPAGTAGTPEEPALTNEAPMPIKPFEAVRLVRDGASPRRLVLSEYFKDAETPALTFTAKSDKAAFAMVKFDPISGDNTPAAMDGPEIATDLVITSVAVGKAKVTVTAYDGVNAPINAIIDVTVVDTNSAPTVTVTVTSAVTDLQMAFDAALKTDAFGKLYLTGSYGGAKSFKFKAQISTGAEGKTEDGDSTKFVVTYGDAGTAKTSAIATATVSPAPTSTALVEYTVTVTPLKAGSEKITIKVEDSFGSSSVVGTDGVVDVIVNTPPTVQMDAMKMPVTMKDVTLYVSGAPDSVAMHSDDPVLVAPKGVVYNVATYFVIEDVVPADTRCTYSASPSTAVGVATASTTLATVMFDGTELTATAVRAGTFDVTLTCRDKEATVTDSARVTVYN
jgi:hypothetical protein